MDGESFRAELCMRWWAGMTASERTAKKTPAALLPLVDDLMKRSIGMGSPYENGVRAVVLDDTPFGVIRFKEFLSSLPAELRALYVEAVTPLPS